MILGIVLCTGSGIAQTAERVMLNWESPENIHDFAEDQHGLLYVLSDQALYNLYGNNLSVLADSSLKGNTMQGLLPQSKDKLSIIPSDGFPLQYDLQNDEILMLANNKRLLALHSYVLDSANKTIWLGSLQQGLLRYKNGQIKKIVFSDAALSKNFASVSGLNLDAQGALWLLSQNGHIAVFDKDMGLKHFFHIRDAFSKQATFKPRILKLNRNNMLILPNSSNIIKVSTEDYSQEPLKIMVEDSLEVLEMKNISDVAVDEEQDLWIGTRESGLWKYEMQTQRINFIPFSDTIEYETNFPEITSLYRDKSGAIWIGTGEKGIFKADPNQKNFNSLRTIITDDSTYLVQGITSMVEHPNGSIWMGTSGQGLFIYDQQTSKAVRLATDAKRPNQLSNNRVWSIDIDKEGRAWVGTQYGLNIVSEDGRVLRTVRRGYTGLSDNAVKKVFVDSQNNVWVGTENDGLNVFVGAKGTPLRIRHSPYNRKSISQNEISCIFEDRQNRIWVGTKYDGLNKLVFPLIQDLPYVTKKSSFSFNRYQYEARDTTTISGNNINVIFQDSEGQLYIGTDNGLNLYDTLTERFKRIDLIYNRKVAAVQSIEEDFEGNLWIASSDAIIKYQKDRDRYYIFDREDGLSGERFMTDASLYNLNGQLIFGQENGALYFKPEEIEPNRKLAQPILMDLLIFDQKVEVGSAILPRTLRYMQTIDLSHDQNYITLQFTSSNYTQADRNLFKYRLLGYQNEWVTTGQRQARFTNLKPGEYTFELMTANNDGLWNTQARQLKVVIHPSIWNQAWFRFMLVLVALVLAGGFILWRFRQINRQRIRLEREVRNRTKQIARQKGEIERKNKELANINSSLEEKVEARTIALQKTLKTLIKTDEELNTFLYRTSHDLRGPVTSFLGLTQLARMESNNANVLLYLDKIENSGDKLLHILKKLNDVNVIFQQLSPKEDIALESFCEELEQEMGPSAKRENVSLIFDLNETKSMFQNKALVKVVVTNLIENAIQFHTYNKPFVKVSFHRTIGEVNIFVEDNGHGISPDAHDKIFNMFYRASEKSKGSGLGLYISQKAVDLMDGRIKFTSKYGNTVFVVNLPA